MFKRILLSVSLVCLFVVSPGVVAAATPNVTSQSLSGTSVGRYQKFEVTFQINKSFPGSSFLPYYYYDSTDTPASNPGRSSPYGVDGITIDGHFRAPSGRELVVPAFYYRNSSGSYSWKLRFAPEELGNYQYWITIQDKEGNSTSGTGSFTSVTSSSKGFVRPSKRDSRFLEYSNGESFVPVGAGAQWSWGGMNLTQIMSTFGQNGVNLTRVWDQNDGFNLTVESEWDTSRPADSQVASIPKGTQPNQENNLYQDQFIEAAEQNGVGIQLCSHGDAYWIWDASIYDEGWNPNAVSPGDKYHLNYWKRNFRYRVARWGYSTAILAWEHWNELGHMPPGSSWYNFYQTYGAYQKATDPYGHIRTTSQNSQAYSPGLWSSTAMDLANYHDYLDFRSSPYTTMSNDEVDFISRFAWCLTDPQRRYCNGLGLGDGSTWSGSAKPWVWGEIGVYNNSEIQGGEAGKRALHNFVWAGLFSPMVSTPLDWYQEAEDTASRNEKWASRKAAKAFFAGVDHAGGNMTFLVTPNERPAGYTGETVGTSDAKARVYAMRRSDKKAAYLWVQHRDYVWSKASTTPMSVSPSITLGGMLNENYRIETWNTSTGQIIRTETKPASSGNISFSVPGLTSDVAVKVVSTSSPVSTPTPTVSNPVQTPTPTPVPTSTSVPTSVVTTAPTGIVTGNGDVNRDGTVTVSDVSSLSAIWFTPVGVGSDQYPDTTVNSFDFAVVKSFLTSSIPPTNVPTGSATATPTPRLTPSPTSVASPTPTLRPTNTPVPTTAPTSVPGGGTPPPSSPTDWSQHGHDAQHTSFTSQVVNTPWRWKWSWNGPNSSGGISKVTSGGRLPVNVEPITGAGLVFIAAGSDGIYALSQSSGSVAWRVSPGGSINSTPAFDSATNSVFAVSTNGYLYKLNASNGSLVSSFNGSGTSTLPLPPSISGNSVFFSMGTRVFSVNKNTMSQIWSYNAGNSLDTPPAYSSTRNLVIAVGSDLRMHGINNSTGAASWVSTAISSVYTGGNPGSGNCNMAEAKNGWPVIADNVGYGFIKLRKCWDELWQTNTNAIFAVDLDNGSRVLSNMQVGPGGFGDGGNMPIGPQPVIRRHDNGREVMYTMIRGRAEIDVRWDSHFGQIALENGVLPGLSAGQFRPIFYEFAVGRTPGTDYWPTDEQAYVTMSGDYLFGGHWMAGLSLRMSNPLSNISSSNTDTIISSTANCPLPSHYQSGGLTQVGDARDFTRGFCIYRNLSYVYDQYWGSHAVWVVSGNLVLFKSNDGAIIALENGNP